MVLVRHVHTTGVFDVPAANVETLSHPGDALMWAMSCYERPCEDSIGNLAPLLMEANSALDEALEDRDRARAELARYQSQAA